MLSSSRSVFLADQKGITFKGDGKWSLILLFKNYPTVSGTYQMGVNNNQIEDNEVRLSGTDDQGSYFTYQRSQIPVDIKVDGAGKVSLTIPEVIVGFAPPSPAYKLTATVYEK